MPAWRSSSLAPSRPAGAWRRSSRRTRKPAAGPTGTCRDPPLSGPAASHASARSSPHATSIFPLTIVPSDDGIVNWLRRRLLAEGQTAVLRRGGRWRRGRGRRRWWVEEPFGAVAARRIRVLRAVFLPVGHRRGVVRRVPESLLQRHPAVVVGVGGARGHAL